MKRITALLLTAVTVFASCGDDLHYDQLKAINRNLELSNALIASKTKETADRLRADSALAQQVIMRKIDTVRKKSGDLLKYIKSLKDGLGDLEKDKKTVMVIFETNKKGPELYRRLALYNESMRQPFIDEDKYEEQNDLFDDLTVMNDFYENEDHREDMWIKMNLNDKSTASVKALLNLLQNDVVIVESRLVDYYRKLHFNRVP